MARRIRAAVVAGLVAGAADLVVATLIYALPPLTIMQSVARGLLGRAAFDGGVQTAALGVLCQAVISVIAALVYVLASTKLPALLKRPVPCGIAFGVVVYLVMTYVVVPLSAAAHPMKYSLLMIRDIGANALFGLIIALVASRMLRSRA